MNKFIVKIVLLFITICAISCEYDNYEEPKLQFTGNLVYDGNPIGVSYDDVYLELWEEGFQEFGNIRVAVDQDGSFSALLFPGSYKVIVPRGQGPFENLINTETNSDTIPLHINQNRELDIEVLPYYMIQQVTYQNDPGKITANFDVRKVIIGGEAKSVERVQFFINKTSYVDSRFNIASESLSIEEDFENSTPVTLSLGIPDITPSQDYIYARVGVKIRDIEDMIFSPVQKLSL